MRRFSVMIVTGLILVGGVLPSLAQDKSEVVMTVQVIQQEHRQIMADNLKLTPKEASVFWPIYHEYMAEAGQIEAQYVKLLKKFLANEATMSDEELAATFRKSLELKKQWIDLRGKYFDRIAKAVGVRKATRFAQVENKLDALVDYKLAQAIPLARREAEGGR